MTETTAKPRRRWFRFGLRTMFTLAAVGAVTSYQVNWIRQRHRVLTKDGVYGNQSVPSLLTQPVAPWGLWVFGERGQKTLRLNTSKLSKSEIAEVRQLFPEATLWLRSKGLRSNGDLDLAPGEYP